MYNDARIIHLAEIYTVGTENGISALEESKPFIHGVILHGTKGSIVRIKGVFNDGAMINAIDENVFEQVKRRLSKRGPSRRRLKMADGTLIPSKGLWKGIVEVCEVKHEGDFEVFPSNGSWALLFGKPLLTTFAMVHQYDKDTISLPQANKNITITNQFGRTNDCRWTGGVATCHTADIKQRKAFGGNTYSPLRQVSHPNYAFKEEQNDNTAIISELQTPTDTAQEENDQPANSVTQHRATVKEVNDEGDTIDVGRIIVRVETVEATEQKATMALVLWRPQATRATATGEETSPVREVSPHTTSEPAHKVDAGIPDMTTSTKYRTTVEEIEDEEADPLFTVTQEHDKATIGTEQPITVADLDKSFYTRATEPFLEKRVAKIVDLVTIGDDLTADERSKVVALIREFADCFALSVSEVTAVKGGEHKLEIKPGTKFATKVTNRPFTPPQQVYLNKVLDELLDTGVIRSIAAEDVKCCSQVTLAQKVHTNVGLTMTELKHRVNDECVRAGLPTAHDLPPREEQTPGTTTGPPIEPKWRFCMNFAELNKATAVRPMPQGNIRAMQHNLSGKQWISKFDFASGFYACPVAAESQPYAAFYTGGRGYMTWNKMPFGFTGAPTTFHGVTSRALGDMVGTLLELFTDDGGISGDDFTEKMTTLRTLLE